MSSAEFRLSTFVRLDDVVDPDEVLGYLREVVEAVASAAEPFLEVAFVLVDEADRTGDRGSRFTTRATFQPGTGWRRADVAVPA